MSTGELGTGDSYSSTSTSSKALRQGEESNKALRIGNEQREKSNTYLKGTMQATLGKVGSALGAIQMEALKGLKDTMDGHADALERTAKATNDNVESLRRAYGGLGLKEFDYIPESAASNAVRRFQVIRFAAAKTNTATMGMQQSGKELLESLTKDGVNIFDKYFDSAEEAATNVQNILGDLSTTYGKHVADLSDKQIAKLSIYEDSLGVTSSEIQSLFQKQIGFTEEITLGSMDKLGVYASNLSKELNIPMTTLTQSTMKMMSNTEMFGDITVEEATRMSAKLTQLGYTYEELNAVQSKFATFSGAAQAAGTMAQLTGVQVDAMKMSYLASEGKFDELIEYQRDSLLKAGFTKEKFLSQSNSMKNAIAKSFGRSQEELAYLLSDQRKISSQAELDSLMGKEDEAAEEGFEKLLENLTQTKNAYEDVETTVGKLNTKMYVESSENAYEASKNFSRLNTELANNTNILGTSQSQFSNLNNAYIKGVKALTNVDGEKIGIKKFTAAVVDSGKTMGKEAANILKEAEELQGRTAALAKQSQEDIKSLSKTRKETLEIEEQAIKNEQQKTNSNNSTTSAMAQQFNSTVNIPEGGVKVYLDSKEIAASINTDAIVSKP
jgi:hypothetical protein